jgi:cytochrome P450
MATRSFAEVLDDSVRANVYELYDDMRTNDPCFWDEHVNAWIVTDYATVSAAVTDKGLSSVRYPDIDAVPTPLEPIADLLSRWMLYMDPPDHTRMRTLVGRAFTPRAVANLRPTIVSLVDELIDDVIDDGEMDFIAKFAYPLPLRIICGMFGIPEKDAEQMRSWSTQMNLAIGNAVPSEEDASRAADGLREMEGYLREFLNNSTASESTSLLNSFLQTDDGEMRLTNAEVMANIILFLLAGHATTTNLLGNGMLALLRNPEQLARLRADPSLIASATEELLRYDSPVQVILRRPLETMELGDKKVSAGDMVLLLNGAANRDPAALDAPDQLDITRNGPRHISFGHGAHFCIGAALARLEAEIAIPTLLRRLGDIRLTDEMPRFKPNLAFRGMEHLRMTWHQ